MSPRSSEHARRTCICGASLRWEGRKSGAGERWIATCSSESCGMITMRIHDGPQPQAGLDQFMLDKPPPRYLSPWSRLFFRSIALGYQWRPHHEGCWNCSGELVVTLDLPPQADRQADPHQVVLCLHCGDLVSFDRVLGDQTSLVVSGPQWDEPDLSIRLLRQAIHERAGSDAPGEAWSFE